MAWNPPDNAKDSGDKKQRDPWTDEATRRSEQGPPHLTDLFLKLKDNLRKQKSSPSSSNNSFSNPFKAVHYLGFVGVVIVAGWLWASVVRIGDDQEAIVTRFGVYQDSLAPGVYWRPFGIDDVQIFDRKQLHTIVVNSEVLTQDLSLAQISAAVSYQIASPRRYLFSSQNPQLLLSSAIQAGLQGAAASNSLDAWLSNNNPTLQQDLTKQLNARLADMPIGVNLMEVKITDVAVPEALKDTFAQITALYSAEDTEKDKAAAYEKEMLPPAQTKADALIASAKTDAARIVSEAKANIADFLSWLPAYEKAPAVTRYRLYTKVMIDLLSNNPSVISDSKGSNVNVNLTVSPAATTAVAATSSSAAITASTPDYDTSNDNVYGDVKGGYG